MIRTALVAVLTAYQRIVSPLLPPACRFHPTSSEYFRQAVLAHGARRSSGLGVRLLAKCHPCHPVGFDPVDPGEFRSMESRWKNV